MALRKTVAMVGRNFTSFDGVTVDNGEVTLNADMYIKVEYISGNKDLISFKTSFTELDEVKYHLSYSFVPTIDSNFIEQAYNHLKILPEYIGSVDC